MNERWKPEAMGLFAALVKEEFLATLLLLMDISDAIAPLNLALQKSHESLCFSDGKTYIDKTQDALISWQSNAIGLIKKNLKSLSK